jgi:hypothetical protein
MSAAAIRRWSDSVVSSPSPGNVHEPQQGSESVWLDAVQRDAAVAEQLVFEERRAGGEHGRMREEEGLATD